MKDKEKNKKDKNLIPKEFNKTDKSISSFLDEDYKEYSIHVIENRAIPSICDGFKPTQRKIFEAAKRTFKGSNKPIKIVSLTGELMAKLAYNSGDSSANQTIIGMAQDFKNSIPLFDRVGQFGSMRSPEAGAPRYISIKPSSFFDLTFKDSNLLEYKEEDGKIVEPNYFLPIIPMVILNGGSGVAIAFSSDILNRNPLDVIKACQNILNGKKNNFELVPFWKNWNGSVTKIDERESSWVITGKYEETRKGIKITELPPSLNFDKIESIITDLEDSELITSIEDSSSENLSISITYDKKNPKLLDKILKKFKFTETVTENLTLLDENKKILIFNNVEELVEYFVNWRLKFYTTRKQLQLKDWNNEKRKYENQIKFIDSVSSNKIILSIKSSKSYLNETLEKLKFDQIESSFDYLINLPIHWISDERKSKLENEVEIIKSKIIDYNSKTEKDLYLEDLKELEKEIKKLF